MFVQDATHECNFDSAGLTRGTRGQKYYNSFNFSKILQNYTKTHDLDRRIYEQYIPLHGNLNVCIDFEVAQIRRDSTKIDDFGRVSFKFDDFLMIYDQIRQDSTKIDDFGRFSATTLQLRVQTSKTSGF